MTLNVLVRQDILTSWQRCVVAGLRPDHFELAPGFVYGESLIGTNAIGTAIAQQAPSVVAGAGPKRSAAHWS